ncbi:catalase-3 [Plectosphaerella plurivora]|uniref:Catalase n=1 Tax=Plectosphaerella plurivora TaxID=936078 RepID=A0A9P8VC33_9PEZI|nr:catalase-3 [Plectosphaerella plurivora]
MHGLPLLLAGFGLATHSAAQCPYAGVMHGSNIVSDDSQSDQHSTCSRNHIAQYEVDDSNVYMTSDVGGPIEDQNSLKAGERGPSLLEDFILRQKITRFDHERVPERAVHARGAGAYGTFVSNGNWSNITAASFLAEEGKTTPVFVRFSTVAGSRGSADTVRDVRGFAVRFWTDEGIHDVVGNNIPVFFIQDAAQFPDLIHAVKPSPDNEIPQAATAHDSAWDFFSQETTSLHTLLWAMSNHGLPRSYRHMNGFGVNTYRFVTNDGHSKLIKWHFKSRQGVASLLWEEAQILAGRNPDYHRRDLWDAIEAGNGPEWDVAVQIIDEEDAQAFKFDLLDATKLLPEELVPLQILGRLKLDANPTNYFAETEQIMFQPGHIVRGIDFSEDPLLQGRTFSYLDTQLNRNLGSPNFEQIPINRPINSVHNNNRDGAGQQFIHRNTKPYSPNSLNSGSPKQANQTQGRGFFTAMDRSAWGPPTRERSASFADHWTQPRLFYNSLTRIEKQFVIDAVRFETASLKSHQVKANVLRELNRVDNNLANHVASFLGMRRLRPDPTYYHNNMTRGCSTMNKWLKSIAGLKVGILTSTTSHNSLGQAEHLADILEAEGVVAIIVGETLADGVEMTYARAHAADFDGILVTNAADQAFVRPRTTLYPKDRPSTIIQDAYRWGKPIGLIGSARKHLPKVAPSLHRRDYNGTRNEEEWEEVEEVEWMREVEETDKEASDQHYEEADEEADEETTEWAGEEEEKTNEEADEETDEETDDESDDESDEEKVQEETEFAILVEYGVFPTEEVNTDFITAFKRGLSIFKFQDRFARESE